MAGTQVQRRRGSTAEHSSFTGAVGELTVDVTKNTAVVHDGLTPGGFPLAREDALVDAQTDANNAANTANAALPKAGGTMTGPLELAGNATEPLDAVPKQQLDAVAASIAVSPGAFRNLKLSATGTNASVSVSYDSLVLTDGSGAHLTDLNASATINTATTGAGGLDTGTLAGSTWYSVWRIAKTDGTKSWLISLSATAPTMPSGYTLKARIGWIRTDGTANKYPLSFTQQGRRVQYKVVAGSNVTATPVAASGVLGTWSATAPTYASVALGNFVPSTAGKVALSIAGKYNNGTSSNVNLAPNAAYSGVSTANPPPISTSASGGSAGAFDAASCELVLESTNVYGVIQSTGGAILVSGWEDNL